MDKCPYKTPNRVLCGGFAPHESVRPVRSKPVFVKGTREDEREGLQPSQLCVHVGAVR